MQVLVGLGEQIADAWRDGLGEAIATLATWPRRCPIVPESSRFRNEVRQLLYRRTASSVAYRILFTVQDDSPDGPVVVILALRHGSARPITRAEAREIEAEE